MAVISTTFKMVDDMSDKLANLGTAGRNVTQELTNIGTSSSSLDEISTSAESAAESLSTVSNVTKNQEEIFENHAESLNKSTQCIENASTELDEYSDMATNAKNTNDTLGESAKGLGDDYDSIGEKVKKTTEETDKFGEENKTVFADLEGIIASAGIVAFLKKVADEYNECIDAASEYETYVAKVSTLADPNQMSVGDMSSELLELSQKTGQAATNLAEAEYQALSAGVATKDAAAFVEKANELAVGGFTETATAVDVLTTALNAYQLDASETNRISAALKILCK